MLNYTLARFSVVLVLYYKPEERPSSVLCSVDDPGVIYIQTHLSPKAAVEGAQHQSHKKIVYL